jgi:glyoxylase-like metal-dependent hydrolase (beta-lactamase superfamily II)
VSTKLIKTGLHQISLPGVNAFLLDGGDDGLVLIDTGVPGSTNRILKSVRSLGRAPEEVRHILVTHAHADHTGSLAQIQRATGGCVYMHRNDATLVQTGRVTRRMTTTPGFLNAVMHRVLTASFPSEVEPATPDELVSDRDTIPIAGGISVIHTPGHTEGHVAFLAEKLRTVFVGDAAANLLGLRTMPIYEHLRQGVMSLRKLAGFDFDTACFGHGQPIRSGASPAFRRRWGSRVRSA